MPLFEKNPCCNGNPGIPQGLQLTFDPGTLCVWPTAFGMSYRDTVNSGDCPFYNGGTGVWVYCNKQRSLSAVLKCESVTSGILSGLATGWSVTFQCSGWTNCWSCSPFALPSGAPTVKFPLIAFDLPCCANYSGGFYITPPTA
jgi:hypothetical protein